MPTTVLLMFLLLVSLGVGALGLSVPSDPPVETRRGELAGRTVALGETFEVILRGNPSTGYEWRPTRIPVGVVQVGEARHESIIKPQPGAIPVGAPCRVIFTFLAKSESEGDITFAYSRSLEKNIPPLEIVTQPVVVREK